MVLINEYPITDSILYQSSEKRVSSSIIQKIHIAQNNYNDSFLQIGLHNADISTKFTRYKIPLIQFSVQIDKPVRWADT